MPRNRQSPSSKINRNNKRGRKPHILIEQVEQIYKIINAVQINKELVCVYFNDDSLVQTVINILKDSEIDVEKVKTPQKVLYKLKPDLSESAMEDIDVDMFDDEMLEEGFLF